MLLKDNKIERSSGILMPIFSLPSDYGIGTLGKEAYNFVDFLKKIRTDLLAGFTDRSY